MNPYPGKIVCVGRNYAEHAAELGNAVPEEPILFIKPATSLVPMSAGVNWDRTLGSCHYETEICLRIGQPLQKANETTAMEAVDGVTLGLDLTLRDLQNTLKQKGYPWERAKAFDGACLLGDWLDPADLPDYDQMEFSLHVDDGLRQQGYSAQMLTPVGRLLSFISHNFTLLPGDVVMTGTPKGVGPLSPGQRLLLALQTLQGPVSWSTRVN